MLDAKTGSAASEPGVGAGAGDPTVLGAAGVPPTLHHEESHQGPCKHNRLQSIAQSRFGGGFDICCSNGFHARGFYLKACVGSSSLHTYVVWVQCRLQKKANLFALFSASSAQIARDAAPQRGTCSTLSTQTARVCKMFVSESISSKARDDNGACKFTCADQIWTTQQRMIHHASILVHSLTLSGALPLGRSPQQLQTAAAAASSE